jgi:DNA mismatch endonuclease (patch repair protein)
MTMRANRAVSARETAFRKAVWRAGARGYRVHPSLPGKPDIYFPALKLAVFVHGCFWHRCPEGHARLPRANADFWREKLLTNVARDAESETRLRELGIEAIVVWEHDIRPDVTLGARALVAEVMHRRSRLARRAPMEPT